MALRDEFSKAFTNYTPTNDEYNLIQIANDLFIGINQESKAVLVMISNEPNSGTFFLNTKKLNLEINSQVEILPIASNANSVVNIISCEFNSTQELNIFWDVCEIFLDNSGCRSNQWVIETFTTLKSFFSSKVEMSLAELQGLYAELFTILSLQDKFDLSNYWQSVDKMKFDFSLGSKLKLEIKSTISTIRKHHFKHDQLMNEIYEIYVLSYLMREDDQGLSLFDLIMKCTNLLKSNEKQLLRLYKILNDNNENILNTVRYSQEYLLNQRKYFKAIDIPRFAQQSPEGVINAEYDCLLDNINSVSEDDFIQSAISAVQQ